MFYIVMFMENIPQTLEFSHQIDIDLDINYKTYISFHFICSWV